MEAQWAPDKISYFSFIPETSIVYYLLCCINGHRRMLSIMYIHRPVTVEGIKWDAWVLKWIRSVYKVNVTKGVNTFTCILIRPQFLILWFAFPPLAAKWARSKLKKHHNHFIFYTLPTLCISLELLVPQKWFTYQYLQDLTRNTAKIEFKGPTQNIKW